MPPSGQLEDDLVAGIAAWIEAGAAWPKGLVLQQTPKITEDDRDWWCYQPLADPLVPVVDDGGWCRNEIDRFVFDRLHREDLRPAEEAAPAPLGRRVHFALTGLPPDAQTAALLQEDGSDSWYEELVDRLLEDPAYGE